MITTYIIDEFKPLDKKVKMTFFNDEGFIHERIVNIPYLQDGSLNETYFQEIIEGQFRGVTHKEQLGIITFVDPDKNVGIAST